MKIRYSVKDINENFYLLNWKDNTLYYDNLSYNNKDLIVVSTSNNKYFLIRKKNYRGDFPSDVFYTSKNTLDNIGPECNIINFCKTDNILKIYKMEILFSLTKSQAYTFSTLYKSIIESLRNNMHKSIFNKDDKISFKFSEDGEDIYTFTVINIYGVNHSPLINNDGSYSDQIQILGEEFSLSSGWLVNRSNIIVLNDIDLSKPKVPIITKKLKKNNADEIHDMVKEMMKSQRISSNMVKNDTSSITKVKEFVYNTDIKAISDLKRLGIGGLQIELKQLINSLVSRMMNPDIVNNLGIKHTKGIILYGPPGCGKTSIARHIGNFIGCKDENIEIVNGPELLSPFVGTSELNIRKLFEKAEENPLELHIIIFDEFDSIAGKRDSSSVNKHQHSVVNQLLAKLDGVEQINNLLVIGLTNRLDMLDPAIIRPGRFDLKLKIELPDKEARIDIISVYIKDLQNKITNLNINELAELCDGFSGADIEYMVKNTINEGIHRQIDYNNIIDSIQKINEIHVSHEDFINSIKYILMNK